MAYTRGGEPFGLKATLTMSIHQKASDDGFEVLIVILK